MLREPAPDRRGLVAGGVVEHEVHFQVRRARRRRSLEELQELDRAVALVQRADHLARLDVQRGVEAGGAVALVVVGRALGRAGQHRQGRRGPIQRLDLALLVDASTTALSGGFRYRPQMSWTFSMNSGSLESFQVSWRCGCSPNARQIRITASGVTPSGPPSTAWTSASRPCGLLSSVVITTRSTSSSVIVRGRPGRGSSSNPSSRLLSEPVAPLGHRRPRDPLQRRDLGIGQLTRRGQHNPRPQRQRLRGRPAASPRLQHERSSSDSVISTAVGVGMTHSYRNCQRIKPAGD